MFVYLSAFVTPKIYHAQGNVENYSEDSSILSGFSKIHHFPPKKEVRNNLSI